MPRLGFSAAICLTAMAASMLAESTTSAVETVAFRPADSDEPLTVKSEVLVEAQDGGMMLLADDGQIWTIQPDQIIDRKSDSTELQPIDADEMQRRMLAKMGPKFIVYRTSHYVIIHNTNEQYVRQVGSLFEQLYRGFFAYWKNQRWDLPEPRFPLVALVFADRQSFLEHGIAEVGPTAKSVIGYYHLTSNRMTTFNVPNLERSIATIIHEATHQLSYNCGLQTRFADNPMWVSEGLATFFEAPDFNSPRGWRSIGRVNQVNLQRWRKFLPTRPAESLTTLLADDTRFRNAATATNAYAECWALTYFLLKTRRKEYVEYLRMLSEGKPLAEKTRRERVQMFEQAFDTTVAETDKAMVAYIHRLR
jgi:hypothetical protein